MAIKAFGATVAINGTNIGSLRDISLNGIDVNMLEVTDQASAGGWKRFIGGLKDGGSCELAGNYDFADAGQVILRENMGAATTTTTPVLVTLPDGKLIGFDAVIGPYRLGLSIGEKIPFTSTLKIDGLIGFGARAALTTSMTGTNNDVTLTSRRYGVYGNSTTITLVNPGSGTVALSVAVSGQAITVTLGYATGAITTTGSLLIAAIAASTAAADLVNSALAPANDGTGLVTALSSTPLTGGGV
jgi:hypothetical protein